MVEEWWEVSETVRREAVKSAREFRKEPTRGEEILWRELRGRKLDGIKFRRQQPIGPFIVDFCAPSLRLVIEIDGPVHATQPERDAERQDLIERLGFRFVQITSDDVEHQLGGVLTHIRQTADELQNNS